MSRSAIKARSVQKEISSFKNRRSVSADTRARGSYVPERKRTSSEEQRISGNKLLNLRWGGSRKSSINLQETKRKDTRPLSDKAYQKRKISELVKFLEETGFSPPITAAKLMAPSKKDFENIFQFLYRFFDPAYEIKRIEEEGPKILKNLNYPFSVNKSAFAYVARTNWPSLLGILIWLMDLNMFAMKIDMNKLFEIAGDSENADTHKILLRYICQCHHNGIDNEEEEKAIFTEIIKSNLHYNLDELVEQNEEKKRLLASVEKEINDGNILLERNVSLETNIEKYEEYISKMKSHYESRSELCEKLMAELKEKESDLKKLQEEVAQKQDVYDAQGFDGKMHLGFFEVQKRELAEKLEKKRTIIKELQDKCWEAQMKHRKIIEKVTAANTQATELYNNIVDSVRNSLDPLMHVNIPQVQKLRKNFLSDFTVCDIPPTGINPESITSHRDSWKSISGRITSTDEILRTICSSLSQKLTECEMKKSEESMKLKLISLENNKLEQDLNSKKKLAEEEISALETQCEKICEVTHSLQEEKSHLEKIHREMAEEKKQLYELLAAKEKELKDYLIYQKEMFEYFSRNEKEIAQECEEYGNEIAKLLEETRNV